ncbi:MAG TPA: polysaccharide pyruvyl transferase family protein [Solirubrobacterales bacterium]|jgi:hypothetical protein
MSTLWTHPDDRRRLDAAESVLFLVGSYDGSGNYGDVLQLASAIEISRGLPGSPLVVPVIERETYGHHRELRRRFGAAFDGAAFAFFQDGPEDRGDGLVPLSAGEVPPAGAVVHVYGGGFLNGWWGERKAAHVAAAEALTGGRPLPLAASGLQVEERAVAPGGVGHDLLARASWIGVRDADSGEYVRRGIPAVAERVELAGDDALPFLLGSDGEPGRVVNLHLNDGSWIGEEAARIREAVVDLVRGLGGVDSASLELQPVIAYEDPRISERRIVADLLERHGGELEAAGFELGEPLDVLEDALDNGLGAFRRARLTVSCSYHVTLTSLLAGIPAVMLAQNEYYAQKAAGLRDLFRLEPGLVGVRGGAEAVAAAAEALRDGPARRRLVDHLRARSDELAARFERSRAALSVALHAGLRVSALESELATAVARAQAAESELAAIQATRGWRLLNRLRAARDMMR